MTKEVTRKVELTSDQIELLEKAIREYRRTPNKDRVSSDPVVASHLAFLSHTLHSTDAVTLTVRDIERRVR